MNTYSNENMTRSTVPRSPERAPPAAYAGEPAAPAAAAAPRAANNIQTNVEARDYIRGGRVRSQFSQ